MSASVIPYETLFLRMIWQGCFVLIFLSLSILFVLIVKRTIQERRSKKNELRRQELNKFFFIGLKSSLAINEDTLPILQKNDPYLIMRIAIDILRSLRGEDAQRIMHIIYAWNIFPYLKKLSLEGSKSKRIQVLTLLSYFSDVESLQLLVDNIKAQDMYVQIAALRGLASRNATTYMQLIIESLTASGQTNTLMLADILQRFGEPIVPFLVQLVQSDAKLEVKIAGLNALGSIGSIQSVSPLILFLDDPNSDIRAQSISALAKIGDPRAASVILQHLSSSETVAVRIQAAKALGVMQLNAAIPILIERLTDETWWVRYRSAEALYRFGDKGISLLKSVSKKNDSAALIAQQVLGEFGVIV
ncbi:MAG: HEAT repeat domain-containing protein [Pseudomonadota bacterium]